MTSTKYLSPSCVCMSSLSPSSTPLPYRGRGEGARPSSLGEQRRVGSGSLKEEGGDSQTSAGRRGHGLLHQPKRNQASSLIKPIVTERFSNVFNADVNDAEEQARSLYKRSVNL